MSPEERLKRWLPYRHSSGWLGDAARVTIPKLEHEIAAQFGPEPVIELTDYEKRIAERLSADGSDECRVHGTPFISPGICPFCVEEAS